MIHETPRPMPDHSRALPHSLAVHLPGWNKKNSLLFLFLEGWTINGGPAERSSSVVPRVGRQDRRAISFKEIF